MTVATDVTIMIVSMRHVPLRSLFSWSLGLRNIHLAVIAFAACKFVAWKILSQLSWRLLQCCLSHAERYKWNLTKPLQNKVLKKNSRLTAAYCLDMDPMLKLNLISVYDNESVWVPGLKVCWHLRVRGTGFGLVPFCKSAVDRDVFQRKVRIATVGNGTGHLVST